MLYAIFDIDNTLSDCAGREHLAREKNWDVFYESLSGDRPHKGACVMLAAMLDYARTRGELRIVLLTGRPEKYRKATMEWFAMNVPGVSMPDVQLVMRTDGDHRHDYIVKSEFIDEIESRGHRVLFAVDDRRQCVDMYRSRGIQCFDCAGNTF